MAKIHARLSLAGKCAQAIASAFVYPQTRGDSLNVGAIEWIIMDGPSRAYERHKSLTPHGVGLWYVWGKGYKHHDP